MFLLSHVTDQEIEAQSHEIFMIILLFSWLVGLGQFQKGCRKVEISEHYSGSVITSTE